MGLQDFADDQRLAWEAQVLARGLVEAQVSTLRRRWRRRRIGRTGLTDVVADVTQTFERRRPAREDVLLVYGIGLMYSEEGEQSVVLADPLLFGGEAPTAPVNARDVRGISEAISLSTGLPPGVQALAIPAPEPQFAPGEKVNGPGDYGTLGARVTTRMGQEAILTAGHVAVARTVVHDVAGNAGTVVFSVDPAQVPAAAVTADVAVVVPDTVQTQSQVRFLLTPSQKRVRPRS